MPVVRPSPIAGSWYPGRESELRRTIEAFLQVARQSAPLVGVPVGLVVPHAGYDYSGQVAAYAYRQIEGRTYDTVILLGPSHHAYAPGALVCRCDAYATPLGEVPVARDLLDRVEQAVGMTWLDRDAEHSLEIQLPFLQTVLGEFRLLPLMLANQRYSFCARLAPVLADIALEGSTLLVASSDLSHFHNYDTARALDGRVMLALDTLDMRRFAHEIEQGRAEACGSGAIITVTLAAQELGAAKSHILAYANSGDVTGDRTSVVGYLAAALLPGAAPAIPPAK